MVHVMLLCFYPLVQYGTLFIPPGASPPYGPQARVGALTSPAAARGPPQDPPPGATSPCHRHVRSLKAAPPGWPYGHVQG